MKTRNFQIKLTGYQFFCFHKPGKLKQIRCPSDYKSKQQEKASFVIPAQDTFSMCFIQDFAESKTQTHCTNLKFDVRSMAPGKATRQSSAQMNEGSYPSEQGIQKRTATPTQEHSGQAKEFSKFHNTSHGTV